MSLEKIKYISHSINWKRDVGRTWIQKLNYYFTSKNSNKILKEKILYRKLMTFNIYLNIKKCLI